jgi:polar amino acid transport system ATP-binding protein
VPPAGRHVGYRKIGWLPQWRRNGATQIVPPGRRHLLGIAMEVLVELSDVCKSFAGRVVLDGVSLRIHEGETVALIGPSGGGKSTLIRCINGLTPFDAGEVRVGPHVLKSNGDSHPETVRELRRSFGMVFQDFQLFPHLTVLGNVIEAPMRVRGQGRAVAEKVALELLSKVGLEARAHDYPQQLSGGQKQRVAIARALAMEPRGLLCDEITSALDPELKNEVLSVVADLKRDGLTLLMVTHEIGFARKAADRVFVLAEGKIIEEGPAEEVLDRPKQARTQQFLSRVLG